jgi:hypothetical protein
MNTSNTYPATGQATAKQRTQSGAPSKHPKLNPHKNHNIPTQHLHTQLKYKPTIKYILKQVKKSQSPSNTMPTHFLTRIKKNHNTKLCMGGFGGNFPSLRRIKRITARYWTSQGLSVPKLSPWKTRGVIYAVYHIHHPKIYVGLTKHTAIERFWQHLRTARTIQTKGHKARKEAFTPLYLAMLTTGWKNWRTIPLEKVVITNKNKNIENKKQNKNKEKKKKENKKNSKKKKSKKKKKAQVEQSDQDDQEVAEDQDAYEMNDPDYQAEGDDEDRDEDQDLENQVQADRKYGHDFLKIARHREVFWMRRLHSAFYMKHGLNSDFPGSHRNKKSSHRPALKNPLMFRRGSPFPSNVALPPIH